jgi:hypothetical protein
MFGSGIDVMPAPMFPAPPPSHDCSSVEVGHHCRNADLFSALTPSKHTISKFLSRIFLFSSHFPPITVNTEYELSITQSVWKPHKRLNQFVRVN